MLDKAWILPQPVEHTTFFAKGLNIGNHDAITQLLNGLLLPKVSSYLSCEGMQ
jgi:hypothetical protein